jgi:catechol 2,3-dioxygenase-like lactoylglutathione lyase family enzyme
VGLFERVTIRAADLAASRAFYETVLPTLGLGEDWKEFELAPAGDNAPPTRRLHIGFWAPSRAEVDEFWRVGTAAGYRSDGEPGPRPQYGAGYYGAFLLDPDGNSAEAVRNEDTTTEVAIDHLWIRVADLDAARAFYEPLGERAGFALGWTHDDPPRVGFKGEGSSFSLVLDGAPTESVELEFAGGETVSVGLGT